MLSAKVTVTLDFSDYGSLVNKYINEALNKIGYKVAQDAKNDHRYQHKTGNLKESTRFWVNKATNKVRVYISENQADYGKYVHGGHGSWEPDRFIDNALEKNRDWIDDQLQEAINKATKEFNRKNRL